ncbi:tyrosine-type recombinase/integrase [Nocardia sp. NPDC058176]|uniref:tyrosine-type recombinase/integrase n=1 Tax=Nocardia sp. NPDC058176 TaxID=3346368 RepID=UPI0036DB11E0
MSTGSDRESSAGWGDLATEYGFGPVVMSFGIWLGQRYRAARSRETYLERAQQFLVWIRTNGFTDALASTAGRDRAIAAFTAKMEQDVRDGVIKATTLNLTLTAIDLLYASLGMGKPEAPRAAVTRIVPATLTASELRALLRSGAEDGPRAFAVICLALEDCGPTEAELVALDVDDVDLADDGGVTVARGTQRQRWAALSAGARVALRTWMPQRDSLLGRDSAERALFVSFNPPHRRLVPHTIDTIVRRAGRAADLVVAPGTLRATAQQRQHLRGDPDELVAQRLGLAEIDQVRAAALTTGVANKRARIPRSGGQQLDLFGEIAG